MSDKLETAIGTIATLAPAVGAAHAAHVDAIDAERAAEAEILTRAIEAARPGLRAISSRIQTYYQSGPVGKLGRETERYDKRAGVKLAGGRRNHVDGDDTSGATDGLALYLLADGTPCEVSYAGHWTRWTGRRNEWEATITPIDARQAMDRWDLDDCLSALADALASDDRKGATDRARARTEKLRALAALVK